MRRIAAVSLVVLVAAGFAVSAASARPMPGPKTYGTIHHSGSGIVRAE